MLYVGLTGNIASGKSEVTRLLASHGATIIDADILAREAVRPGSRAMEKITARWGQKVLDSEGNLNRTALRKVVFEDRVQLDELNAIVHPEVALLRDVEMEKAVARGDKIIIYAVPLLFEAGMADDFDAIVLIDAPRSAQLERLIKHRKLDATEALNMVTSQMSAELKRPRADYVINNSGSLDDLERQTEALWKALVQEEETRRLGKVRK